MKKSLTPLVLLTTLFFSMAGQTTTWNNYTTTSNPALPDDFIRAVQTDASNNSWISSAGGSSNISKLSGGTVTNYSYTALGLSAFGYFNAIAIDGSNQWFGSSKGLVFFNGSTPQVYTMSNSSIPDDEVLSLALDNTNNLWVGTKNGLAKFDKNTTWQIFNTGNGLPGNEINAIATDGNGNIWVATTNSGIAKYSSGTWTPYNQGNSGIPSDIVAGLAADASGNIWVGTDGGGIGKFDGTTWTVYNTSNSQLHDNQISTLAFDSRGYLWAGTQFNGIALFDGTQWSKFTTANSSLPNGNIRALSTLNDHLWAGTNGKGVVDLYYTSGAVAGDTLITIAAARAKSTGSKVYIKGVVINGKELGTSLRHVQDSTGGIAVFSSKLTADTTGDLVEIKGTLKDYNNLLEIDPVDTVMLISQGNALPAPVELSIPQLFSENYEGQLVKVKNVTFTATGNFATSSTNYDAVNGTDTGEVRIYFGTDIGGTPIPSFTVDIVGVMSQYQSTYQLFPRSLADFTLLNFIGQDKSQPEASVKLYPLPANDILNLELNFRGEEIVTFEVTDVNGKIIRQGKIPVSGSSAAFYNLDTRGLNSGVYFLNIHGSKQQVHGRFIKL